MDRRVETMLEAGQVAGKYEIIKPLGAGGEGCVYLAKDGTLSRLVAVKRMGERRDEKPEELEKSEEIEEPEKLEKSEKDTAREVFLAAGEMTGETTGEAVLLEAAFLRDLGHPMLPVVYDLFYEDGWYLVLEYIEGISLHNYIKKTGYVEEEQGRIWAKALLEILEYFHTRKPPVIYRDLKPGNIMVCPDKSLRLVDLGAACLKSYEKDRDLQMALTSGYGAPEQRAGIGGRIYADERSDIYAFGRVLYYMMTGADPGKPPYGHLPVHVYNPLIGESLERVIDKCTREDPGERYQVVEEIRQDLCRQNRCGGNGRRRDFLRHMEKRVWLTQKLKVGL